MPNRSSRRVASLAGRTLQDEAATPEEKSLAAAVLSGVDEEQLPQDAAPLIYPEALPETDPLPEPFRDLEKHAQVAVEKRQGLIEIRAERLLALIQAHRAALRSPRG